MRKIIPILIAAIIGLSTPALARDNDRDRHDRDRDRHDRYDRDRDRDRHDRDRDYRHDRHHDRDGRRYWSWFGWRHAPAPRVIIEVDPYVVRDGRLLHYHNGSYIVVSNPIGQWMSDLPPGCHAVRFGGRLYWTRDGVYFVHDDGGYRVVVDPYRYHRHH